MICDGLPQMRTIQPLEIRIEGVVGIFKDFVFSFGGRCGIFILSQIYIYRHYLQNSECLYCAIIADVAQLKHHQWRDKISYCPWCLWVIFSNPKPRKTNVTLRISSPRCARVMQSDRHVKWLGQVTKIMCFSSPPAPIFDAAPFFLLFVIILFFYFI